MATYILLFDSSGRTHEDFTIPANKKLYLVKAPQVKDYEATVCDLATLTNYVIPAGETIIDTGLSAGAQVSLAFMGRTNASIHSINAETVNATTNLAEYASASGKGEKYAH